MPWDAPLPLPQTSAWRRWLAEIATPLASLLPTESELDDHGLKVLSARDEHPSAQVRCMPDGRLCLMGVELSAWQGINLPRQWDDPERPADPDPYDQLADFAVRLRQTLQVWKHSLSYLSAAHQKEKCL
jgi:hypothetical protein